MQALQAPRIDVRVAEQDRHIEAPAPAGAHRANDEALQRLREESERWALRSSTRNGFGH